MIDLHPGEEIKLVVRKHWFVFVVKLLSLFLVALLPLALWLLLRFVSSAAGAEAFVLAEAVGGPYIVLGSILWLFFMWVWGFIVWTDYYLDVWVITDERIMDIEQKGFFRREISTFRTDRIQDITTEVHGIIPTFLNFGDIHVQTAGESRNFEMTGAPAPTHLKQVISSLQSGAISKKEGV